MNLTTKLLIAVVIAALASTVASTLLTGAMFEPVLLIGFAVATIASTLVANTGSGNSGASRSGTGARKARTEAATSGGERESGKVKWFNISKGFGFIIKDDGDEVFVHFRSIRGGGRRGLREGQRVSFVITDSDKGPQAEDVAADD